MLNYRQLYKIAMDKLKLREGNRRDENIIKTSINEAYKEIYAKTGKIIPIEYTDISDGTIYLPKGVNEVVELVHSKHKHIPEEFYTVYNDRVTLNKSITLNDDESIKVNIIKEPTLLSDDSDVPDLSSKYHIALVYYAMFMYNDDFKYLNRYNYFLEQMESDYPRVYNEEYVEEIDW